MRDVVSKSSPGIAKKEGSSDNEPAKIVSIVIDCLCNCLFAGSQWVGSAGGRKRSSRLIVLTDISSLTQTEGEPDDGQSLIRLMLYTNELDIEGWIATSNLGRSQR